MAVKKHSFESSWQPKPKIPKFTHTNDKRVVLSVNVDPPSDANALPTSMLIMMEKQLEIGVPVQVQFEITPHSCIGWNVQETQDPNFMPDGPHGWTGWYSYHCEITSVKSRIKPGDLEFEASEDKAINHIIDGTEDEKDEKERVKKRTEQAAKHDEANRFTGIEL